MTPEIKQHPIDNLINMFGNWLKHRQDIRGLRELGRREFEGIARELCVTPADLDALVRQGPHAADQLSKLLKALNIDERDLARTQPFVLRDMARVCAACQQKHRCDSDLKADSSARRYEEYCLNASTIDALDQSGKPLDHDRHNAGQNATIFGA